MGIWDNFFEKAKSFFTAGGEDGEEGTSSGSAGTKSRCYYDLLGVGRDAGEDEIKKSFKKLALKWHPDKNPGKEEQCAAYFILIQQAYEVLSDPQERAFYDRHRENILYQNSEGPDERKDTGIGLDPFMSTSCWRGVFAGEEERLDKFYSVYRDLFHQLAAEEYAFIEDPEERNYPVFGTFTSDYETVVAPFYAFWLNFHTRRSFAWLDTWDLREAPDRPSARIMEKENRKLRERGQKQRSEEIRKLVEFIRKHDKRVELARQRQKERNAAIQKKVEEQRRQAIRRNLEKLEAFEPDEEEHEKHMLDLEQIEAALDSQFGTVHSAAGGGGSGEEGSEAEDEEGEQDLRCIVCEKSFKSRKVLENHQRSRKHRQMVDLLKTHMKEEDQKLFVPDEAEGRGSTQEDEEEGGGAQQRRGKRRKKKNKGPKAEEAEEQGKAEEENGTGQKEEEQDGLGEGEAEKKPGEGEEPKQVEGEEQGATANAIKPKKAKRRRALPGDRKSEQPKAQQGPTDPVACDCTTCGAEFESKSKLHAHLKETGHAALKTAAATGGGGGMEGGKRNKGAKNKGGN